MSFTPSSDKDLIHARIRGDPVILNLMDLSGAKMTQRINDYISKNPGTSVQIATNIIIANSILKRNQYDNLATDEKRICIYTRPSRKGSADLFTENILQIDVHVPAKLDYVADKIQERITSVLQYQNPDSKIGRFEINKKTVQFDGSLGDLITSVGFYCVGSRFCYYGTI